MLEYPASLQPLPSIGEALRRVFLDLVAPAKAASRASPRKCSGKRVHDAATTSMQLRHRTSTETMLRWHCRRHHRRLQLSLRAGQPTNHSALVVVQPRRRRLYCRRVMHTSSCVADEAGRSQFSVAPTRQPIASSAQRHRKAPGEHGAHDANIKYERSSTIMNGSA